jgi:hypothetical protein
MPILAATLIGAAACSGEEGASPVSLAPVSALPAFARGAPTVVQEAYRFAVANPEVLDRIPCYCGCGAMEHTSNLACYVKEFREDGSVVYDDHAFG